MTRHAMHMTGARRLLTATFLLLGTAAGGTELRGHGGPVRAIALTPDGRAAITGSFDTRAIVWSLSTGEAREVLLFHSDAVNAVAVLPGGRVATAGADDRIAIWEPGHDAPVRVLEGHTGPVAALAVAPDGSTLASASWDTTVRIWPLSGGEARVLEGHKGNVNAVAFLPDGTLVSAGYDGNVMFWSQDPGTAPRQIALPTPVNALVALPGDRIALGGADGRVRAIDGSGRTQSEVQVAQSPVTALAVSPNGRRLAAAGPKGNVVLLDAGNLTSIRSLNGEGVTVWSIAFTADGKTLLTGGIDPVISEWDIETGERRGATETVSGDPLAEFAGDPGAKAFRACVACHTLDPGDGDRAGPTLHGLFGRRIASLPDYRYSPALRRMDIVWTPKTVSKLFEVGPNTYTPGTKMPEQTIPNAETRAALIRFLQRATRPD